MNSQTFHFGQFTDAYPPIMDGVSMTVKNYALWLNRANAQSYVVTPRFPGYSDQDEFPVVRYFSAPVPGRQPYRIGLPDLDARITHVLKDIPLNLVHAHSPFSAGMLAAKTARYNHIPVLATFHSKYRDDFSRVTHQKSILNQIMKKIVSFYEAVDEVWIPQRHVEETIREYGYKGRLEVVDNGIDLGSIKNIQDYRTACRGLIGVPHGKKVLLYVGQLILEKNLKFLVDSLSYLKDVDYTLYFVGQGYARPVLERLFAEAGLSSRIKFTGPVYDREELKRYYAMADLFLFPSLYDNAPLVVREAASLHTPSLLLRGSTAAEVIRDQFNGFLSENGPELYARRIKEILMQPETLKQAGENASLTLCRTWEEIVQEVKDRYIHLIRRKMN